MDEGHTFREFHNSPIRLRAPETLGESPIHSTIPETQFGYRRTSDLSCPFPITPSAYVPRFHRPLGTRLDLQGLRTELPAFVLQVSHRNPSDYPSFATLLLIRTSPSRSSGSTPTSVMSSDQSLRVSVCQLDYSYIFFMSLYLSHLYLL